MRRPGKTHITEAAVSLRRLALVPVLAAALSFFGCANAAAMQPKLIKGDEAQTILYIAYFMAVNSQQSQCTRQGLTSLQCSSAQTTCSIIPVTLASKLKTSASYSKEAVEECYNMLFAFVQLSSSPCASAVVGLSCVIELQSYGAGDRATYLGGKLE